MANKVVVSRIKLIFVAFLFLGPLSFAFIWYYGLGAAYTPKASVNNAPLITPVVVTESFSDKTTDGESFDNNALKRRWTIVHFIGQDCQEPCQKALYNTRQTRIATGKDANRIQRIALIENSSLISDIAANHADLKFISANESKLRQQLIEVRNGAGLSEDDGVMIDPLGNIMMGVPVDLNPSLLLKDLKKLLKLSRVG